jgi:ABC-type multidrug transport system fused ATPase/permease subunit
VFDKSISYREIQNVIDKYNMGETFKNLPRGLDSNISSTSTMSNTLKVSIHLLRALVRNPSIILIDSVFDSFTTEQSEQILESIIDKIPISLIVTRDPHIIQRSNRSLVLNHSSLMELKPSKLVTNLGGIHE